MSFVILSEAKIFSAAVWAANPSSYRLFFVF